MVGLSVVVRDALTLVLLWCGAVTTVAGAAVLLWRVAIRPHADRYVQSAARAAVAPLIGPLEAVRSEVATSPDEESLAEKASTAADAAARVERKVDSMHNTLGRVSRRQEQIEGRVMMTQSVLDQHVQESAAWLGRAVEALEEQGIDLPDRRAADPFERSDDDAE